MPKLQIFPSILSADFGNLQRDIDRFDPNVDGFHFDVMDGQFVPNLSIGAPVLKCISCSTFFDVHLMVHNPENLIEDYHKAGAHMISFHIEANMAVPASEIVADIQSKGMKAGVAIKPKTGIDEIESLLEQVDFVLVMSVEPGYSGQSFMPEVLPKAKELRARFPDLDIEIDGGISDKTVSQAKEAGVNMLVSASYLYGSEDEKAAVQELRM